MDKFKKLIELRSQIPEMDCYNFCSSCCGPTAWSRFEWYLIPDSIRCDYNIFSLKCDFFRLGKCIVYEYRPITCRLFGVVDDSKLRCPKGIIPSQFLTADQAAKIMQEYDEIFFQHGG